MSTKGITDTRQVKHRFGKQSAKIACVAYDSAKALERILMHPYAPLSGNCSLRAFACSNKNAPRAISRGVSTLVVGTKQLCS